MKFRESQKNLISNHPSLDRTVLSNIKEDDEISDENEFGHIDEGKREEPKRKEWIRPEKRPFNFYTKLTGIHPCRSTSVNDRLHSEPVLFEEAQLDYGNKSDQEHESDHEEDTFDLI
mmetsp:Transcript_258/g.241  ORF Transcript_258/g.241 Transcript_258/m.241 type:complete len:117 (+) Transcript_258:2049-2399(+)